MTTYSAGDLVREKDNDDQWRIDKVYPPVGDLQMYDVTQILANGQDGYTFDKVTLGNHYEPVPTEGWGVMRPGDRRHHYYAETMSLCRRVGFYRGYLSVDTGEVTDVDCAACRKELARRKQKEGR